MWYMDVNTLQQRLSTLVKNTASVHLSGAHYETRKFTLTQKHNMHFELFILALKGTVHSYFAYFRHEINPH